MMVEWLMMKGHQEVHYQSASDYCVETIDNKLNTYYSCSEIFLNP